MLLASHLTEVSAANQGSGWELTVSLDSKTEPVPIDIS
jgi:hypothetical protein